MKRNVFKSVICSLLIVVMLAGSMPAFAASVARIMKVNGDYVRLRESSDEGSSVITRLRKGTKVLYWGVKDGSMYKVMTTSGKVGYVYGEYLTTYGENVHLNGRQTLAYARIRKIDSDFSRADRQRTVLVKLLEKLKAKSAAEILALAGSMSDSVATNMNINDIVSIALQVVQSGLSNVEMLRLPMNDTFKLERRNEQEMFYDCDWKANALELYNFIYA